MRLLVDAHALLWWLGDNGRLSTAARKAIETAEDPRVGAGTLIEIAVKRSLGKLEAPEDFGPTLLGAGVQPLAVSLEHAASVERLPWHHRDPFDRMLIAQAAIEGAAIISRDQALRPYDVTLIW